MSPNALADPRRSLKAPASFVGTSLEVGRGSVRRFGRFRLVGSLCFGSAALWLAVRLAVWLVCTLVASASPRSRIVCNGFWDLSRRERCLDKSQKPLRAAWIGVMQKNWIPQEMPRGLRQSQEGRTAVVWVSALVRPAGAAGRGGLSAWPRLLVPGGHADMRTCSCRTNGTRHPSPAITRNPLDELERALNPLRHIPPGGRPQRRGSSCGIQFFCITPIQAALTKENVSRWTSCGDVA